MNSPSVLNSPLIFVYTIPTTGHLNPILPLLNDLVIYKGCKVVCYSTDEFRQQIENTGSEYRSYKTKVSIQRSYKSQFDLMLEILKMTDDCLLDLIHDIVDYKPNLILYDQFSVFAKWTIRMLDEIRPLELNELFGLSDNTKIVRPLAIMYTTRFVLAPKNEIYPNKSENKIVQAHLGLYERLRVRLSKLQLKLKQYKLCKKFKIKYINPLREQYYSQTQINLVFVAPDIQPRAHLFDCSFKFVGPCINETMHVDGQHSSMAINKIDILNKCEIQNPLDNINQLKLFKTKLIYVAFGAAPINVKAQVYFDILNGFCEFLNENKELADNVYMIMSTGAFVFDSVQSHLQNKLFRQYSYAASNIRVQSSVAQLNILKRAFLFVTHAGMNSVNESLHYGVPMVCLPHENDQHLIAHRISFELGLGITLSFTNLRSSFIKDAFGKLFTDLSYHARSIYHSKIIRKYIGERIASKIILKFIKNPSNYFDFDEEIV